MYFEEGRRYFDRNGEYRVIAVRPTGIDYTYISGQPTGWFGSDLETKRLIDVNVRAERLMQDFIDYCRLNGCTYADLSKDRLAKFCARYEQVTGQTLKPVYGVYIRKTPGSRFSLSVVLPSRVLNWMPSCFHGSWRESTHEHITIYSTSFVWTLFENGLRLGSKHRKPEKLAKQFNISIQNNQASLHKDELVENYKFGRIKNEDGSISPAQDTGFRLRRAA
jgi:hypothetical protein